MAPLCYSPPKLLRNLARLGQRRIARETGEWQANASSPNWPQVCVARCTSTLHHQGKRAVDALTNLAAFVALFVRIPQTYV